MYSRWFAAFLWRPICWFSCLALVSFATVAPGGYAQDDSATEKPAAATPAVEEKPTVEETPTAPVLPAKPTQQEGQAFIESLKAAVETGEARQINLLVDWDVILARGTAGFDPQQVDGPGLLGGFRGIKNEVDGDIHPVVGALEPGLRYKPLRVRYKAGRPEVVSRVIFPVDGGVTYQELPLGRRADGAVLAVDLYRYSTGEYLSRSFRRFVLASLARTNPAVLTNLSVAEREFLHNLETDERLVECMNRGEYEEALAAFALLPTALQRERPTQLLHLRAAPKLGLHGWQKAIADARSLFPNDPAFDLQLMGNYNQLGKRDEALAAIDRLEKAVGGDPYLLTLRGNLHLQAGKLRLARQWIQNAISAEPSLVPARLARINCALYENDFPEVVRQLDALEDLGEQLADLTKVSGYKRFVASPEYRDWIDARRRNSQTKAK